MARKFKDYYDLKYIESLGKKISIVDKYFDEESFIESINKENIESKEFFERQDIIAMNLEKYLSDKYELAIETLTQILGPELETDTGMFKEGWWLWPVSRFIERNANINPKLSLEFIKKLTQRFTGEFAIRPILNEHPELVLHEMIIWSKDSSVHVRRLSSEGVRINLPWSGKCYKALDHFELYKTILNNLKDSPEKFVQKSIGNNINDLMKEFPDLANEIICEWRNEKNVSSNTLWIIKHGTRSLRK